MELQLSANLAKLIDRLTRLLVVTTRRSRCVSSRFCSSRSSSAASVELASDVPDPHDQDARRSVSVLNDIAARNH